MGDGIRRYKQPSFPQVLPEPLTEADRENGYRWKGWAYVTGKVWRDYLKDGRWDDWRDSNTGYHIKREDVFKEAEMWNLNGHWEFRLDIKRIFEYMHTGATVDLDPPTITTEEFGEPKVVPLRKPTCAQIPGTPEYEKQQVVDKQKAVERRENETKGPKEPKEPGRGDPGEIDQRPILHRNAMPSQDMLPGQAANPNAERIDGVSQPVILSKVEPVYSEEARQAKVEGTVLLKIIVDVDGRAKDIKVVRGLGLGLDERAVAAVQQWTFAPGKKNGQAVRVEAQVEVNFVPTYRP